VKVTDVATLLSQLFYACISGEDLNYIKVYTISLLHFKYICASHITCNSENEVITS